MRRRVFAWTWMVLSLLPCPMLAEEGEPSCHFGLQVTAAAPRQDFRDITGRGGAGGGIFIEQDLDQGWSLRTRFDLLTFGQEAGRTGALPSFVPPQALRVAANLASLGVELRFQPVALGRFFLLGGVAGSRAEFTTVRPSDLEDANGLPLPGQVRAKEKTSMKLGLALGTGYRFSPDCTFSLRYTAANLGGITLATLEGGLDFRF